MYSFFSDFGSSTIKNQVREQIFSLLGNAGKTLFEEEGSFSLHLHLPWYKRFENNLHNIWETPYKRTIGYLMILFSALMISPPDTSFASETEKTFIVTAYYSPLPDQSFYFKWNYNAERRLNGNGTNGASGTPVFTGMIAAPKSYDFGTNIFFSGLGVGRVEDRGWAIVAAWDRGEPHDRIDIWMWYGEEGLRRALLWWRREVVGTFITPEVAMTMNPIDLDGIDKWRVNLKDYKTVKNVAVGTISEDVINAFSDLGYTAEAGDIKSMITGYQMDHGIITTKNEIGAGSFGPKTRLSLAKEHGVFQKIQDAELKIIEENKKLLLSERDIWEQKTFIIEWRMSSIGSPKKWEKWEHIIALQNILSWAWFFSGKKSWIMLGSTIIALKKYQKSRGLIPNGQIDNATRSHMVEDAMREVG